ncbi:MAG: uracil-DNA glycosylase [Zetaproteobacteria bacterium]|nr:MAG: uracil-DNA glycosylase [Zetaproteobacteria bacterium]
MPFVASPSLVSATQTVARGMDAAPAFLGASDAYDEAVKSAKSASTLEELREAISAFDGIAIKKTATNMVFADGNSEADVMFVGEAPGADGDRLGKPFSGLNGRLLNKIIECIGLSREDEDPKKAVYLSNVLNWRPPGNRTPSPAEVEVSLPFIQRHIQLAKPKILVLLGGISAKALLDETQSMSRLRKSWHDYVLDKGDAEKLSIPTLVTYHPAYLLRTPLQKKAVWADMLMLQDKINNP